MLLFVICVCEISLNFKINVLILDGTATSLATDDLNSNSRSAVGVVDGGGQLLLYLHRREWDSNE